MASKLTHEVKLFLLCHYLKLMAQTIYTHATSRYGTFRRPKKGSALLFFPAAGGIPNTPLDIRTLHCGEIVSKSSNNDKWISQLWLRETPNAYIPTAPQGNTHAAAADAISGYCTDHSL
jgi:hypothetical protein